MIVSLYDATGIAVAPWRAAGYHALIADMQHKEDSEVDNLTIISGDLRQREYELIQILSGIKIHLMCCFPPCTDLAVSGSRHFGNKKAMDPFYLNKALDLIHVCTRVGEALQCPYFVENPVSVLSTLWRKPDFMFHPFEFGGYLSPEEYLHPLYPEYIAPRDAYSKLTCLWGGNGFILPNKQPVKKFDEGWQRQGAALGGKSQRTKNIRSATPRGFAKALFLHYSN